MAEALREGGHRDGECFDADCAVCLGDVDAIAAVAARAVREHMASEACAQEMAEAMAREADGVLGDYSEALRRRICLALARIGLAAAALRDEG